MTITLTNSRQFFKLLFVFSILLACQKEKLPDNSNTNPGGQNSYSLTPKEITLTTHCKGFYEYLPEGYSSTGNIKYPLMIFLHGGGEIGSDSTDLNKVLKNGPLKWVSNNNFPTSFTVNGKTYRYIIFAPQFTSADDSYPDEINSIIEYAKQNYKVDQSRIYLTGLSVGAGICWNYVGKNANYARKIAAMVPIASYINETRDEFDISNSKAQVIAATNVPIWATHNDRDNICPLSWVTDADNLIKSFKPLINPSPKLTVFSAYGHEGWTQTYDPSFKENNMNIYEWMLQYHR